MEERLGQGRENVKELIESDPKLYAELDEKVRAAAGLHGEGEEIAAESDEETLEDILEEEILEEE